MFEFFKENLVPEPTGGPAPAPPTGEEDHGTVQSDSRFDIFDQDGDGTLAAPEIKRMLEAMDFVVRALAQLSSLPQSCLGRTADRACVHAQPCPTFKSAPVAHE